MSPALQELKLLCAAGFYLGSNFIIVFVPVVVYLAYSGSLLARCLVLLTIFDYCWPLRQPGLWLEWCKFTNDSAGKRSYFGGCECIFEGKSFSKERNYLLVYHPHALFGICYNIITEALHEDRGIIGLFTGANVLEKLPLLRRVLVWWGYTSVSANAMRQNMQRPYPHNVLTLMPGGIAEMFYGIGDDEQIILSKRKGFAKLALQTGCSLVPVYTFGANQVYTRVFGPRSLAAAISSLIQTSLVVWYGRWGIPFGVVPHRSKMVAVVGVPLDVAKVEEPSREQVEALHARYVAALRELFERNKHRMGEGWESKRLYLEDEALPGERVKVHGDKKVRKTLKTE